MPPSGEPLLLASRSPRRATLLEAAGIPFERGAFPDVDESLPRGEAGEPLPPAHGVETLAARKARAAARLAPGRRVLAADTLVFLDGRPLGKPEDAEAARAMLAALSGRTHEVWTGVAIVDPGRGGEPEVAVVGTRVRFRSLGTDEIAAYVASGEPLDKAGAYALQGGAAAFVEGLEGPRDNVIGLPVGAVRDLLQRLDGGAGAGS